MESRESAEAHDVAGDQASKEKTPEVRSNKKPIDDFLVFYLISYQADPECPTPVRRLLEGGLLDKRPDRLERIAAALRKLETEGHIKGRLQARLEGHDLSLPPVRVPGLSVPLGEEREAGPTQEDRDEGDAGPSTSRAQGRHASADIGDRGGGTNTEGGPTRQAPKTGRPRYPKKLWDVGSRPRRAQLPSASSPLNIEPRRLTDEEAEALYELILRERTGETGVNRDELQFETVPYFDEAEIYRGRAEHSPEGGEQHHRHPSSPLPPSFPKEHPVFEENPPDENDNDDDDDEAMPDADLDEEEESNSHSEDLDMASSDDDASPPGRRRRPPPRDEPDPDELDRGVTTLRRAGPGWDADSTYKGTRQPPLAIRLEQVLNFLREEDRDRCPDWHNKLREVTQYLAWLEDDDPDAQLARCPSLQVRNMYRDAWVKVRIHRAFERFHYAPEDGPVPVRTTTLPRPSGRLDGLLRWGRRDVDLRFVPRGRQQGRRVVRRVARQVHTRFAVGSRRARALRERLLDGERRYWAADEGDDAAQAEANLFVVENRAYEDLTRRLAATGPTLPASGRGSSHAPHVILGGGGNSDDDDVVDDVDVVALARDRGARRAALQHALRTLSAAATTATAGRAGTVVLPLEHAECERVRREASRNLHWPPARLSRAEMPPQTETAPCTFWWREFDAAQGRLRAEAAAVAAVQGGHGGPFAGAGAGVSPYVRQDASRKLLRECEVVARLLRAAEARERPGTLRRAELEAVNALCARAARGEFGDEGSHDLPSQVRLEQDAYEEDEGEEEENDNSPAGSEAGRAVKSVAAEELQWLRGAATRSARRRMETPLRGEGRLFRAFATRLAKVVEDGSHSAAFARADITLTVEELLAMMNRGCEGPVRRTRFAVADAMTWLPRLHEQGKIWFKEDLECYGLVGLPLDRDDGEPAGHHGSHEVDPRYGSLGLRLGLTLYRLRHSPAVHEPPSRRDFLTSIFRLDEIYCELARAPGRPPMPTLQEVAQAAGGGDGGHMRAREVLDFLRHGIVAESEANETMLARGRRRPVQSGWSWGRDHCWDWALCRRRARGGRRRVFWSMDRWPPSLQTDETRRQLESGADADPLMARRRGEQAEERVTVAPKLRRYGDRDRERVRYLPEDATYPIGDTPRKERMIRNLLVERVAGAIGVDIEPRRPQQTWTQRWLSALLPFGGRAAAEEDASAPDEVRLPHVSSSLMPASRDSPSPTASTHGTGGGRPGGHSRTRGNADDVEMMDG